MAAIYILVLATCIDLFFMSIAYGVEKIKIPWRSRIAVSGIQTIFLGISLSLSSVIFQFLPDTFGKWISFTILFLLGIFSLFQNKCKSYLQKRKQKQISFRIRDVAFVIDILLDETQADRDRSHTLSMKEAIYLGIALSFDSMASGMAYGSNVIALFPTLCLSFVVGIVCMLVGCCIGRLIKSRIHMDVGWISGFLLLILACLRLC